MESTAELAILSTWFNGNDVQGTRFETLQQGQIVEFEIGPGPKGPQARRVRILAEIDSEAASQSDIKTNVSSLVLHIDEKTEPGSLHHQEDVQNRNKLTNAIDNFFLSEYGARLGEEDARALSAILDMPWGEV